MTPEQRRVYAVWTVSESRRKLKLRAVEYKGGKCTLCGYNKCVAALVFHHLDGDEKEFRLGAKTLSWERIKAEADKCILVCANCHAEIHAEEDGRARATQLVEVEAIRSTFRRRQPGRHGAIGMYAKGCRCTECVGANNTRQREYKARKNKAL